MKTSATLLLAALCFAGCKKITDPGNTTPTFRYNLNSGSYTMVLSTGSSNSKHALQIKIDSSTKAYTLQVKDSNQLQPIARFSLPLTKLQFTEGTYDGIATGLSSAIWFPNDSTPYSGKATVIVRTIQNNHCSGTFNTIINGPSGPLYCSGDFYNVAYSQ